MFNSFITPSRLAFLGAAITLSTAGSAFSAIIASDNFNYTAGTVSTGVAGGVTDWNGGTGWNGAWRNNNGNLAVSVGTEGRLHTESATDTHKGLVRTFSDSYDVATDGTMWGSVSLSITSVGETSQYAWLSFMNGTSETFRFGRHQATNSNWGLQSSTNVSGTTSNSAVTIGNAATLLFKMEYVDGNTIYSLWVNPGSTEVGLGTPDAILTRAENFTFDGIRLQSRAGATFDNFVLGTTFADVIPEPSSAMLGLLGSSLLLIRKRRAE